MKKKKREYLINLFGWYGVAAIICAYFLNSVAILDGTNILYQALNGTGAFGIVLKSYTKKDYQPVLLNSIWMCIALLALARIFLFQ